MSKHKTKQTAKQDLAYHKRARNVAEFLDCKLYSSGPGCTIIDKHGKSHDLDEFIMEAIERWAKFMDDEYGQ